MAIIKIVEPFIPSPPAQNASEELRVWLRDEFERLSYTLNQTADAMDEQQALSQFGMLDGPTNDINIPDDPDFIAPLNYETALSSGGFTVNAAFGTIQLPEVAGWIEVSTFYSLRQIGNDKDFTVVAHLEVDGVVSDFPSGSGYVPNGFRDLDLAISSVKTRPVQGGETLRMMFQLADQSLTGFEVLDSTFKIQYLQVGL